MKMLHTETVEFYGKEFIHTYTDDEENKQILQQDTGIVYDDCVDVVNHNHIYVEIDRQ